MKQYMEKVIPLDHLQNPDAVAVQIERTASALHEQGWYFLNAVTDELMESLTLCFERDLEV